MTSMPRLHKITSRQIWRIANVVMLWLGLLLPWMILEDFEEAGAFRVALMGLAEFSGLANILGFLLFAGIASTTVYATMEWIFIMTDGYFPKPILRLAFLLLGVLSLTIASTYFHLPQRFGYLFYGVGLLSSLVFDFRYHAQIYKGK